MSVLPLSHPPAADAVLPIRGGREQMPGSMLVRAALGSQGAERPEEVRAAIAAVFVLAEQARAAAGAERFWWQSRVPITPAEVAQHAGLLISEAQQGLTALVAAGVATASDEGWTLDANVLCEQPLLAAVQWPTVRDALQRSGARLGPALAVYREVGRLAAGIDSSVVLRLPDLLDATLYGRSAVSLALAELQGAGLLERENASARQGVRLRLTRRGYEAPAAASVEAPAIPPTASVARATGAEISFGGHPIHLPAGTPIEVESLGPGETRVRIGPFTVEMDGDGRQTARWGALQIRV